MISITVTMKCMCLLLFIVESTCFGVQPSPAEGEAIASCLERFGGLTMENAARLQRYKTWSDRYEEIPCFTHCYLDKMFDFYNETTGFSTYHVIKQFGRPLYELCKDYILPERGASCDLAYSGFHCLVTHEDDPFVSIDNMDKLDAHAKAAMKNCLRRFDIFEWENFKDYANFPVREPIPCFTKCFIEELKLYDEKTRQWRIEVMRRKLSVPASYANISHCQDIRRRRNRNSCSWIYQDFTCFVMAV